MSLKDPFLYLSVLTCDPLAFAVTKRQLSEHPGIFLYLLEPDRHLEVLKQFTSNGLVRVYIFYLRFEKSQVLT